MFDAFSLRPEQQAKFLIMTYLTYFSGWASRHSLMARTAWWNFFWLRCGFDAVGNTFADPRTCTIGTLVSCLLVDAHCFTFYYYFVVVVVDESFMDVLKTDVSSLRFFRFWRFNSTKSSYKKEFFLSFIDPKNNWIFWSVQYSFSNCF